ncbi:MAG: hypothetical protein M9909_00165 [Thermomicrobiales bacterium]|nr:hypothetical protein [Thermomicrobiales bacterium]
MDSILRRRFSRRSAVAATPMLMAGLLAYRSQLGSAAQMQVEGDCSLEPALVHYANFAAGNLMALPTLRIRSFDPGVGWQMAQSPELGFFLAPPGWTVANGYANTFDRNGLPQWQAEPLQYPFWSTTIIAPPDQSSAYMYVRGAIDNVALTPVDGADLGRSLIMAGEGRPQNVCQITQTEPPSTITSAHWVAGDRYGRTDLLMHRGSVLISEVAGASLGPGTTFMLEGIIAPRADAEDLFLNTYLQILWQFLPKGGGGGDPTPTPTPT